MPLGRSAPAPAGQSVPLDASGLERAREERGEAERALATLKRYAPEKGKLLQPRPDLKEGELFDQGRARQALDGAQEVNRGRAPHGCHPQRAVQAAGPKGRFGALAGTGTCPWRPSLPTRL